MTPQEMLDLQLVLACWNPTPDKARAQKRWIKNLVELDAWIEELREIDPKFRLYDWQTTWEEKRQYWAGLAPLSVEEASL